MTDTAALIALYDAAALGACLVILWEHERPGAMDTLHAWADATGRSVVIRDATDGGAIVHAVEMFSPASDVISVYRRVDAA